MFSDPGILGPRPLPQKRHKLLRDHVRKRVRTSLTSDE